MTATPTVKCPALVGLINHQTTNHMEIKFIRELSETEINDLRKHTDIAINEQRRFKLFKILTRNYQQWCQYTISLLNPSPSLTEDEMIELDRLLMNFLSSAKSLIDHFSQHHKQEFRKTEQEKEFLEYMGKLEANSWAFAFFQDLRNFTQHCGLPVGHYSKTASRENVNLRIVAKAEWLLKHYNNGWGKSDLKASHGEVNLLKLTEEYYVRLTQDFGKFVSSKFGPKLIESHNFFDGLAEEVERVAGKEATFAIAESFSVVDNSINYSFSHPPKNLLEFIGLTYSINTGQKATSS